jgi:F-type H+-transporting ATPase subunit gamma
MTRLAQIEGHIANMGELLDIIGAMRSLASMRVQEAHRAIPGVRRYAGDMAAAIGSAVLLAPERAAAPTAPGRRALILCTAEHGFVGGFNERIIEAAQALFLPENSLFVLGGRGAALVQERGRPAVWTHPMPTRPAAVPQTIQRLMAALFRAIAGDAVSRVEIVFARHRQGGSLAIERRQLLPVDLASLTTRRPRSPPLCNLRPETLLERLITDYVFALLIEAVIESIASENAARFAAMEAAHDNIARKLEQLRRDGRQARQDEITTELLDIVTGAEALHGAGSSIFAL